MSGDGVKQLKKSICPLDCPDSCGLIVHVTGGRVTALGGDPDHPYTNGFICRKMHRYPERLYGSDRILYPQLRIGDKGAGKFRRISWQEAIRLCGEKLSQVRDKFGPETILPYCYAGNMGMINRFAGFPFFHRLGTLQLDQTICSAAAGAGWDAHCGGLAGCPPEQAADSSVIVAWGIDIKVTNVHFWQYVVKARKKGAKLVVIDPCRNETAKSADYYIQVRPGGDGALALGCCKILLGWRKTDGAFIEQSTEGFAEFESYLRTRKIGEFVAASGVAVEQMEQLAALVSENRRTFMRIGVGMTRNSRAGMAVRAVTALGAVLGLFGGGSGRGVLLSSRAFGGDREVLVHKKLLAKETERINMVQLGRALVARTPPVKALVVYNSNPLSVCPDGSMVRQGLAREDLFTVVHEQVMTPTARYADLLLPATTFLENLDLYTGYGHFYLGVAEPVIEPVGEAKSNFDLFRLMAKEMGFDEQPFQESCRDRLLQYLATIDSADSGLSAEQMMDGRYVVSPKAEGYGEEFRTGGRKFSFVLDSESLAPRSISLTCQEEADDPDLQSRFSLQLVTPPVADLLNSTFGERYPGTVGTVLVNPADAELLGIVDKQRVQIVNHRGSVTRVARVTTDVGPQVVAAPGLYWPAEPAPAGGQDKGINDLTSQKLTDMGGGATFHESLVTLVPCRKQ